jgi:hypothetical protein
MAAAGGKRNEDQQAHQAQGEAARFRRATHVRPKRICRWRTELGTPAVEDLDDLVHRSDDRSARFDAALDKEVQAVTFVTERASQVRQQPDDSLLRRIALQQRVEDADLTRRAVVNEWPVQERHGRVRRDE